MGEPIDEWADYVPLEDPVDEMKLWLAECGSFLEHAQRVTVERAVEEIERLRAERTTLSNRLAAEEDAVSERDCEITELKAEVEAVDDERHEMVAAITAQRDECRKLLRECVEANDRRDYYDDTIWEAARAAGGK